MQVPVALLEVHLRLYLFLSQVVPEVTVVPGEQQVTLRLVVMGVKAVLVAKL
jgi:hypothetical protein